jgi:hypothetical protein
LGEGVKVTEEMIQAYIGADGGPLGRAAQVAHRLQAALDLLEPFISAAAHHVVSDDVDDWNDTVDAWDKLPRSIQHAMMGDS